MPGFVVNTSALVQCVHSGRAVPTVPGSRVLVGGNPAVTMQSSYLVTPGTCGLAATGASPCATGRWITGATRVSSDGQPLLLQDSQAICAPTGTRLLILTTQLRVTGV